MRIKTFRAALAAIALGILVQPFSHAQVPAPQALPAFAPTAVIPLDKAVTTGALPNGLRYYIRQNARPEKRVMLQLAVKAGSVDETDAQQGLAHFLEHMGFNGTTRFKPGDSSRHSNRRARAWARTSTRRPVSTTRSTCFSCPPTRPASSRRACRRWRTSPAA